jgi:hypothetical protein
VPILNDKQELYGFGASNSNILIKHYISNTINTPVLIDRSVLDISCGDYMSAVRYVDDEYTYGRWRLYGDINGFDINNNFTDVIKIKCGRYKIVMDRGEEYYNANTI